MPTNNKFYKIQDNETGRFRDTGHAFNRRDTGVLTIDGKMWSRMAHLKNHLTASSGRLWASWTKEKLAAINQTVIEYELVEVRRFPLQDLLVIVPEHIRQTKGLPLFQ